MAIETFEEIAEFISNKESQYNLVLGDIKRLLKKYHDTPEGRRVIYRVASRGDYQQGKEFKKIQRIQQKIKEGREKQKKEGKKQTYSIRDVWDIIGIRVVCVYPSDVDVVRDYIRSRHGKNLKKVKDKEVEKKSGYRAHHFIVIHKKPTLSYIKCEIQIVTMLLETWSFKEHRLIYEKETEVKETHEKRSELLSDALGVIDRQTEVLAEEIEEELVEEERKKTTTRLEFMKRLAAAESNYENPKQKEEFQKLKNYIAKNKEKLRHADPSKILGSLERHKDHFGVNGDLCYIIGLLAVMRDPKDLDEIALTYTEEFVHLSLQNKKANAHLLRSFILFCFGRTEKAVKEAERALKKAEELKDKKLINRIKTNIAYFIADLGDKNRESLARQYIRDARDPNKGGDPQEVSFLNTDGYVKIVFGKDFNEIEEGLSDCSQASEKSSSEDKELACAFFKMHRYKAYKQLLKFSK